MTATETATVYPEFVYPPAEAYGSPAPARTAPARRGARHRRGLHIHRRRRPLTLWASTADLDDMPTHYPLPVYTSAEAAAARLDVVGGEVVMVAHPRPVRVCGLREALATTAAVAAGVAGVVAVEYARHKLGEL